MTDIIATPADTSAAVILSGEEEKSMRDYLKTHDASVEAPTEGHPATEQKERVFAGKYKNPDELEKAYKELETKLGKDAEDKRRFEDTLRDYQTRLSQEQQQRLSYENMLAEKVPAKPVPQIENFKNYVNSDEQVINSVQELSKYVSEGLINQTVNPHLKTLESKLDAYEARAFQAELNSRFEKDKTLKSLWPEVQEQAKNEMNFLADNMANSGSPLPAIQQALKNMNFSFEYLDSVYARVKGNKGAEFWSDKITTSAKGDDEAKKHLGSGAAGSGDSGDDSSLEAEFDRLTKTPGATKDPKKKARIDFLMQKIIAKNAA